MQILRQFFAKNRVLLYIIRLCEALCARTERVSSPTDKKGLPFCQKMPEFTYGLQDATVLSRWDGSAVSVSSKIQH